MLLASSWFFVSYKLSRLDSYKESITKIVGKKLNRDVTFEKGKVTFSIHKGLNLHFTNLVIMEKDGLSTFLDVKTAFFRVRILPLLINHVVFREIVLDQPRLSLKRDRALMLNINDFFTTKKSDVEIKKLTIKKGVVTFLDQGIKKEGLVTSLDDVNCWIDSPFLGHTSDFHITAYVIEEKNKAQLLLEGTYHPASSEKPIYESTVQASIRLKGTDLNHYGSYLKNYSPIEQLTGRLDLETTFSGKLSKPTSVNTLLKMKEGTFNGVNFKNLNIGLKFALKNLNIEKLEVDFFDGKFKAKGKMNIYPNGQSHYEAKISVDRMSLEKIQRYLKMRGRKVTGNLYLIGDVSATGRNSDELKQTVAGTLDVRAEKGVMKKFPVLSKIFSILNVAQLAKLQLPDMARDGMLYKKITFHASLKEGVFSSKDFFIDSDAIQISAIGGVDFLKKKLDYIAGVHPLQTLDVIAAKIPIAGWVITNEQGKLITAYFKIYGTWDNPKVTTITAKSIGGGTLDRFQRIFQLPEKLITGKGNIIMGR